MAKEYYLYIRGQKVKVSEDIYIVYWREKEHEKYLEQVDRKNHLLFFSALDHDGHFTDNIVDESVDVEKIVETQMMIEAVRSAITRLNAEVNILVQEYRCSGGTETANPAAGNRCSETGIPHLVTSYLCEFTRLKLDLIHILPAWTCNYLGLSG